MPINDLLKTSLNRNQQLCAWLSEMVDLLLPFVFRGWFATDFTLNYKLALSLIRAHELHFCSFYKRFEMKSVGSLFLHLCNGDKSTCKLQGNDETNINRKWLCCHVSWVFQNLEHMKHLIRRPIFWMLQSYNVERTLLKPEGRKKNKASKRGFPDTFIKKVMNIYSLWT